MTDTSKLKTALLGTHELAALTDCLEVCKAEGDYATAKLILREAALLIQAGNANAALLVDDCLLFLAPVDFDSYLRYMEKDRAFEKSFYAPRRKQLKPLVDALQDLADGKLELLTISLPPGVGKTTMALFYLSWLAGRHPEQPILTGSHSASFVSGTYGEILRLLDENGEYHWHEVFPKLAVTYTNAKDLLIDIGESGSKGKRFATFEFTSTGAGNAGKLRAGQLLYCDDLIPSLEVALSEDQLSKLWQQYTTDLRQRKIGGCAELHIATRWSVRDVIGRLEVQYDNSNKARFINLPALDENDESNFDYPISAGFSTKFYHEQREIMDDLSWGALYMGKPVEREGRLFSPDEMRYYFELPEQEPDAVIAVCDTKEQGNDYCVMPVLYQYGADFYVDAMVCDNGKIELIEARIAQLLVDRGVMRCRIESNRGGTLFAAEIDKRVSALGGKTSISTKWNQTSKATRIEMASPFIKSHFLFRQNREGEYETAMRQLFSYTSIGKVAHDDVPDSLSMAVDFVSSFNSNKAIIVKRPF